MTSPFHTRAPRPVGLRAVVMLAAFAPSSCLLVPRFEAIDPEYAYVDGCTDVVLQGSEIGTKATVTIGGQDLLQIAPAENDPSLPDYAQDVGFKYYGVSPPAPKGEAGYQDVVMTVDGEELTLPNGFYYRACPGPLTVDSFSLDGPVATGDSVTVTGCGLVAEKITGRLLSAFDGSDAGAFALASSCLTAKSTFTIPGVAPGDYWIQLVHEDGTTYGGICPELAPVVTDTDVPDTDVTDTDAGDTDVVDTDIADTDATDTAADTAGGGSDTGDPCAGYTLVTVTGGE